jgi:Tn3 transposase DDE domain
LIDREAVLSGAAAAGEPWQHYDLGHCSYTFFEQCPHRMACARCDFYIPKPSGKAQLLEAGGSDRYANARRPDATGDRNAGARFFLSAIFHITLDWIEDPELRRDASRELIKGESRNSLARAVFIHRLGEIRDRTCENQQHRASGLNLVVTAIILWNTRYLDRAIDALRAVEEVPEELLAHLSPLGWEHVWTGAPGDRREVGGESPLR